MIDQEVRTNSVGFIYIYIYIYIGIVVVSVGLLIKRLNVTKREREREERPTRMVLVCLAETSRCGHEGVVVGGASKTDINFII